MPRIQSFELSQIFAQGSYSRKATLDIYKANNTVLRLSRGAVARGSITYDNYIRSVDDLSSSMERSIDRISIVCQNVNSVLGFDVASDLRLLDYAIAYYGKIYQSNRNPALIEDIPTMFPGVLANAEADEQNIKFELIVDYESMGAIIASRGLSPLSWWTYKNGIESTSASPLPNNPTRAGYKEREREWEHGGWEFFEEPVSTPPGSGEYNPPDPCFTSDVLVWTPDGSIPIGEMKQRFNQGRRSVFSFDTETGEIIEDEIERVWEHAATGYFTFYFGDDSLNVTKEHRMLNDFGKFLAADSFNLGDTIKASRGGKWFDNEITRIKWNSDKQETVWNLKVKKNRTYFANGNAVSNRKQDPQF